MIFFPKLLFEKNKNGIMNLLELVGAEPKKTFSESIEQY